eukprot:2820769-Pyramimonas_sp.AAC.1
MGPRSAALHGETHVGGAIGAFGRVPYGDTRRYTTWGGHMRMQPPGPVVELPRGPRSAPLGGETH